MYYLGKEGSELSIPLNFKLVFVKNNGERKTLDLQEGYWNVGEFEANGYAPLYKGTGSYYITKATPGGQIIGYDHYMTAQEGYVDGNGNFYSGSMPGYEGKQEKKEKFVSSIYDIKIIETSVKTGNPCYEICDKAGNSTGVKVSSVEGCQDEFMIARAYDENYTGLDQTRPAYYIYYINEE